jgi:hypothetical protein
MGLVRTPYFLVPLLLNLVALGAILAGPLRQPGVPMTWLVIMALTWPWVGSLLIRRLVQRRHADHANDTDFV